MAKRIGKNGTKKKAGPESVWLIQRIIRFQYGSQQTFPLHSFSSDEDAQAQAARLDGAVQDLIGHPVENTGKTLGDVLLMLGVTGIDHRVFSYDMQEPSPIVTT